RLRIETRFSRCAELSLDTLNTAMPIGAFLLSVPLKPLVEGVIDVSPFPEDDDSASESCSPLPVPRSRAVYDGHGVRPRRTASVLVQEMMALEEVEESVKPVGANNQELPIVDQQTRPASNGPGWNTCNAQRTG
ncbi:unnamed protein product, partial [Durusdinium trenchii]